MYSACKLNKQGDNIQPWCTPFRIWNRSVFFMSSSSCCFLTCIQISQKASQVVWYLHLFHDFPQFVVIHTVKGFDIVNKAEVDVFLELSCFFDYPTNVANLISGSSAFSKTSLNIWKFTVHILLSLAWRILNITWYCLSLGLEWKRTFSSPVATAEFSKFPGILSAALSQDHLSGFEIAPLEFHHLH